MLLKKIQCVFLPDGDAYVVYIILVESIQKTKSPHFKQKNILNNGEVERYRPDLTSNGKLILRLKHGRKYNYTGGDPKHEMVGQSLEVMCHRNTWGSIGIPGNLEGGNTSTGEL